MDRLDRLAIFAAVVETGSLAAAGRKLRRSPPAITRAVAALEHQLGQRLLERTTRRLAPTERGLRLAAQAAQLLAAYREAVSADNPEPQGVLRVTAPVVFGGRHVTPVVASFLAAFPAVRIELVLSDRNLDVIDEGLDVAIRIGEMADSSLVARRIGQVSRVLVASPAYVALAGSPESPADLIRHSIVYTPVRQGPVAWHLRVNGRDRMISLTPRMMINHVDATLDVVRRGNGIASALSYQVAEDLAGGRLVEVLPQYRPLPLPVQIVVPTARLMPPTVRAFVDYAVTALSPLAVLRA